LDVVPETLEPVDKLVGDPVFCDSVEAGLTEIPQSNGMAEACSRRFSLLGKQLVKLV
jgi:hypothetical protein